MIGKRYDPDGEYVKKWVPELKDVPAQLVHKPWKLSEYEQTKYNVRLGIDYPHPIRDPTVGDERRKYRYMRRRGVPIPPELEKKIKTRVKKGLNRDGMNFANDNSDDIDDDGEYDDDYDDDGEDYNDDDDEDDHDHDDHDGAETNDKQIENEIKRKMNASKLDKNTDEDLFREISDTKPDQSSSSSSKSDIESTPESSSKTKTSTTKNKWRINL